MNSFTQSVKDKAIEAKKKDKSIRIKTIRAKLVLAFLIPIVFILFLGIVSFNKAAEGIRTSYEESTENTINMTSSYLQLGIETIETISTQYISEGEKQKYTVGYYGYECGS